MSSGFSAAVELFQEFKLLFDQPHSDPVRLNELLGKLKEVMTQFSFMKGSILVTDVKQYVAELALARELLEHACLLSLRMRDIPAFARYFAQLRPFYFDYRDKLPTSEREHLLLGLNLVHLLAQNRLAEFHTELECLSLEVHAVRYIRFPIELEQFMMEGSYNKVLKARSEVPSDSYSLFVDILLGTVRDDIASCSEKAYKRINLEVAKKFLLFSTTSHEDFMAYIQQRKWHVDGDFVVFNYGESEKPPEVPAIKLIRETLSYAKELERIV